MDLRAIQDQLAEFASDRDWDQFHSPKNLSMALSGEVGELLEIFQWLTEEQSQNVCVTEEGRQRVEEEVADVAIYLIRLCDKLNIDLEEAILKKIDMNKRKYPVVLSKGNAVKYNER
jgi:dCTP diphosphatase